MSEGEIQVLEAPVPGEDREGKFESKRVNQYCTEDETLAATALLTGMGFQNMSC
jgi:hypothetical protein